MLNLHESHMNAIHVQMMKLLTFNNFDYGRYLPLTMDIDEPWFGG